MPRKDAEPNRKKLAVRRTKKQPHYALVLPCGKRIGVEQGTKDGHLADFITAPEGTRVERITVDQTT